MWLTVSCSLRIWLEWTRLISLLDKIQDQIIALDWRLSVPVPILFLLWHAEPLELKASKALLSEREKPWWHTYGLSLYCGGQAILHNYIALLKSLFPPPSEEVCRREGRGSVVIFQAEAVRAPELSCQEIAECSRAPGVAYNRKKNLQLNRMNKINCKVTILFLKQPHPHPQKQELDLETCWSLFFSAAV